MAKQTNQTYINKSNSFFNCTDSERAVFEAGIKLGGIFHQFTGTPVSLESAKSLEIGIMKAVGSQPFVKDVKVRIDRNILKNRCSWSNQKHPGDMGSDYTTLTGEMLEIQLQVQYSNKIAFCGMKFVRELDYPLMYVEKVESFITQRTFRKK